MSSGYAISAALLALFIWIYRTYIRRHRLPLPPGPPGKFIVGNLFDMPKGPIWPALAQWKEKYGQLNP